MMDRGQIRRDGGDVYVGVAQAGHQHSAAQIKTRCALGLNRRRGDLDDAIPVDEDIAVTQYLAAHSVEQRPIAKQNAIHSSLRRTALATTPIAC